MLSGIPLWGARQILLAETAKRPGVEAADAFATPEVLVRPLSDSLQGQVYRNLGFSLKSVTHGKNVFKATNEGLNKANPA